MDPVCLKAGPWASGSWFHNYPKMIALISKFKDLLDVETSPGGAKSGKISQRDRRLHWALQEILTSEKRERGNSGQMNQRQGDSVSMREVRTSPHKDWFTLSRLPSLFSPLWNEEQTKMLSQTYVRITKHTAQCLAHSGCLTGGRVIILMALIITRKRKVENWMYANK